MMTKIKNLFDPYRGLPREVYVIFIARIINAMGAFVFPMMSLILTDKIGLTQSESGMWISLLAALFIPANLLGGKLTDHIGRKKIIIIFDTLAIIAYGICAFKPLDMNTVYLIMLASLFMGMSEPAHNALLADVTNPSNRDGAYSLTYLGFNLGFIVGPAVGGLLFEKHLFWFFLGDAITAFIAVILVFIFIKDTLHLTNEEEFDESRELEKREEGSIFSVLKKRPILVYYAIIAFGYNFVYAQWGFLMPIHVKATQATGAAFYGLLASFNGFVVILFTPLLTKLLQKFSNLHKIFLGGLLYAVGFGAMGFNNSGILFFISTFIFTIGEIIVTISHMPFITNHTPASHRGRMSSILPVLMGLGWTLSPLVVGNALNIMTMETAWKIIGFIGLISALFMLALDKMDKRTRVDN